MNNPNAIDSGPSGSARSSPPAADDHPAVSAANARAGLVLFFIYLAFYAGFMGLAAFAPQSMGRPVLGGVNLAITYGMGLIGGALVVAALYMAACARNARLRGTGILPVTAAGHGQIDRVTEDKE
jgi:uncharacterized membrane protein (DUF485 family)